MSDTYIKKTTIDDQISRSTIQANEQTADTGVNAPPERPGKPGETGKPDDPLPGNRSGLPPLPEPEEGIVPDDSWEHTAPAGILGLQAPVKRFKPEVRPETTMQLDLAFDNADLTEVLDLLLYDHFNIKYMMDPSINTKITFHVNGEFSNTTIVEKLNSLLRINDVAIVEGIGSVYMVVRKADAARSGVFSLNDPRGQEEIGDVTRLVKLKYLNAVDFSKTLKFFLSKNAQAIPSQVDNSIIITDTPENMLKAASIVDAMDAPFFRDISWRIFPVFRAKAENIATELVSVFKTNGLFTRPGMANGSYHITALKTINGILVVTKWPEIMDTIDSWIKIMDQADEESSDVFVYYVENGSAADLADILSQVYGGTSTKEKDSGSQKIVQATTGQQQNTNQKAKTTTPKSTAKTVTGDLIGDIKIIADETNNAIVFKANPRDYVVIRKVLKQLDIMPRQVLLNVVVAEVTLNDSFEFGVQWMLNADAGDYEGVMKSDNGEVTTSGDALKTLGQTSGLSVAVFDATDALKTLVRAVGSDSKINILSSPNIISLDNQEATIEVTQETPTISGSQTQTDGTVTNTIEFKKTGIILTAKPSINSRGLVKLELTQEVSEVGDDVKISENQTLSNFLTRKATTSLVVENKQTIFIGGLMRERTSAGDSGIPMLKDIPGLGYLFKQETQKAEKVELIFLITPHVIRSRAEADSITREFTNKISQVKALIAE